MSTDGRPGIRYYLKLETMVKYTLVKWTNITVYCISNKLAKDKCKHWCKTICELKGITSIFKSGLTSASTHITLPMSLLLISVKQDSHRALQDPMEPSKTSTFQGYSCWDLTVMLYMIGVWSCKTNSHSSIGYGCYHLHPLMYGHCSRTFFLL